MRKFFGRKKNSSSTSQPEGSGSVTDDPFQLRGDQLARDNDYNGAVVMYDSAIQKAPYDRNLLLSRAIAHCRATPSRLDLALRDANEALALNPRWWNGWFQKGKILFQMGDLQSAEEALTNAAGFAHNADKIRVQEVLYELRASQVMSLKATTYMSINKRANLGLIQ